MSRFVAAETTADEQRVENERLRREVEQLTEAEGPKGGEAPIAYAARGGDTCECCGRAFSNLEKVALFPDDDTTACWDPCPEPDMWAVECTYRSGNVTLSDPVQPEDAYSAGRGIRDHYDQDTGPRVRLLRIRSTCTALIDRPVPDGVECTYRKEACGRAAQGGKCERHGGDRG